MTVYKIASATTGGAEVALAQLDIQFDGEIIAVWGTLTADLDADQELIRAEVSFLASNTIGLNDARGSILEIGMQQGFTTSGSHVGAVNAGLSGLMIPVMAGERVFLHAQATAGIAGIATFYLYTRDTGRPRLRRRR